MAKQTKSDMQQLDDVWPESGTKLRYVQMHDAFTPLGLAPIMSLGTEGAKACTILEVRGDVVYVEYKGRAFFVPKANISFGEYELTTKGE